MKLISAGILSVILSYPSVVQGRVGISCSEGSFQICSLVISGTIGREDLESVKRIRWEELSIPERFAGYVNRRRQDGTVHEVHFTSIFLNSDGGDVAAALEIGDILYKSRQAVSVPLWGKCASACVFILGSTVSRLVFGPVIVHSPFSMSVDSTYADSRRKLSELEVVAKARFSRAGVSTELWERMMAVPSHEGRVLDAATLSLLRLDRDDPAYEDSENSRKAKELGISKVEYLRRKGLLSDCVNRIPSNRDFERVYKQISACQKKFGL